MKFFLYIPLALQVPLLFLMVRNRAYRACPWFFAYVVFGMGADVARFVADGHRHAYYVTYWWTEAVYCVLGILTMYEVFAAVLRTLPSRGWFFFLFPAILVAGITLGVAREHVSPPRVTGLLNTYIVTGEISVRFVQVFAVLLTVIPLFDLKRPPYHLGIAAGFGIYSTAELLLTTRLADFGMRYMPLWSVLSVAAYSLAQLVWIWSFRVPQRQIGPRIPELAHLRGVESSDGPTAYEAMKTAATEAFAKLQPTELDALARNL
jgi:hypothetical protein